MQTCSDEAVAWFFMGEGNATFECMQRHEQRGLSAILGYQVRPYISISNTDLTLMRLLRGWFKAKKIKHNVYIPKTKPPRKPCAVLKIGRVVDVKKFLEIILPYLIGRKQTVCQLMLECLNKFGREGWSEIIKTKGIITRTKKGRISSLIINWDVEQEKKRFLEIMRYRDYILSINSGRKAKNNYAYFANLWGMEIG